MKLKISKTFATYKTWKKKERRMIKYSNVYKLSKTFSFKGFGIALRVLFSIEFEKPLKN